jgi:hypothetical protein
MSKVSTLKEFLSYLIIKRNGSMHNINAIISNSDNITDVYEKLEDALDDLIDYENKMEYVERLISAANNSQNEYEESKKDINK